MGARLRALLNPFSTILPEFLAGFFHNSAPMMLRGRRLPRPDRRTSSAAFYKSNNLITRLGSSDLNEALLYTPKPVKFDVSRHNGGPKPLRKSRHYMVLGGLRVSSIGPPLCRGTPVSDTSYFFSSFGYKLHSKVTRSGVEILVNWNIFIPCVGWWKRNEKYAV